MTENDTKTETIWAYLAEMLDGEGHFGILHHYKKNWAVSRRGYESEPRIVLSGMSRKHLETIKEMVSMGNIVPLRTKKTRERGIDCCTFELRFSPNNQRIILPKVIPYLILKRGQAEVLLEFLVFRQNKISKARKEIGYSLLEDKFKQAVLDSKPWLSEGYSRKKLSHPMPKQETQQVLKSNITD